jgi:hypothetical protein
MLEIVDSLLAGLEFAGNLTKLFGKTIRSRLLRLKTLLCFNKILLVIFEEFLFHGDLLSMAFL